MMRLFALLNPERVDLEVAEQVFHEVLGHEAGRVRGLGNYAIPKPYPNSHSSHVTYLTEQVGSFDEKMDKLLGSQMRTQEDKIMSQDLDS
ncbi:hypothetical protein CJ030_MR3G009477 [Morella rubra]|uniref:Uncharacterized protein n=1 Tax=Morella rubra TaxID=262757 RepID=A0A6A1W3Z2_9ROSI|nr:hypothetical protein CJ030_MR3G009477 [Morella rubra]